MLKKIILKNFQAHKRLVIRLDRHVTSIVGPSDIGKSAIIRALRWLMFNRPSGDAFIRDGSKEVSVILDVDGHRIVRTKGKKNQYLLNDQEFLAFGNDVPSPISELLDMSEFNFQGQHDNPFWFSETAGEVSRQLNKIINLDIIDTTLANLASLSRKTSVEMTVVRERLEEATIERKKHVPAKHMDEELGEVELLYEIYTSTAKERSKIDDLLETIGTHRKIKKNHSQAVKQGSRVFEIGVEWKDIRHNRKDLRTMIENSLDLQNIKDSPIPNINKVDILSTKFSDIRKKSEDLGCVINDWDLVNDDYVSKKARLVVLNKEIKERMGDTCPLCDQKIK